MFNVMSRINAVDTHFAYRGIIGIVKEAGEYFDTIVVPGSENEVHGCKDNWP